MAESCVILRLARAFWSRPDDRSPSWARAFFIRLLSLLKGRSSSLTSFELGGLEGLLLKRFFGTTKVLGSDCSWGRTWARPPLIFFSQLLGSRLLIGVELSESPGGEIRADVFSLLILVRLVRPLLEALAIFPEPFAKYGLGHLLITISGHLNVTSESVELLDLDLGLPPPLASRGRNGNVTSESVELLLLEMMIVPSSFLPGSPSAGGRLRSETGEYDIADLEHSGLGPDLPLPLFIRDLDLLTAGLADSGSERPSWSSSGNSKTPKGLTGFEVVGL